jgi:hypothetical protein
MIVRISSEGQYRIDSDILDKLNEIDNQIVDLVGKGDEQGFDKVFSEMLTFVRTQGKLVGEDEIVESDVILPPPDITLDEAAHLFHGEGLVPG